MKFVILVADGMADHTLPQLGGKTPLQVARTPHMDALAREGFCGLVENLHPDFPLGSDVAILSLLGYPPEKYYPGRGPLEAASQGIFLKGREVAFRVNLVTVEEEMMKDYSAGHISSREARILIDYLNHKLGDSRVRFYPGVSYRNLMVWGPFKGERLPQTYPPHDIMGRPIKSYMPRGQGSGFLRQLMVNSRELLSSHPINLRRVRKGLPPANMIWIWGGGKKPHLESFFRKYGLKGGVISAVDVIKGIGNLLDMEVIRVRGATGDIRTNWKGKFRALKKALRRLDFVFLHIEATDEAAHMGDVNLKIKAIEIFDQQIVGRVRALPGLRIMVATDHVTSTLLRTHTRDPVPFIIYGIDKKSNVSAFSEITAKFTGVYFSRGEELMRVFLGGRR